ncbi:hypothetical protein [Paenibacillus sp.]|uniref:hypothetical protein n=1 Tax=Paenibacillus sp. TaxID=58172 RepID=UPI002D4912C7|nr:hypothetical protein [Paenibacillus sp.]HZG57766.1 hypothetical protein [Paenibacillus sp.]
MKKPFGIKAISFILLAKIWLAPISFLAVVAVVAIPPGEGLYSHFQDGFLRSMGITSEDLADGEVVGAFLGGFAGQLSIPLLLAILAYIFLRGRNFGPLVAVLVALTLYGVGSPFSLVIHVFLLVLLMFQRKYFAREDGKPTDVPAAEDRAAEGSTR